MKGDFTRQTFRSGNHYRSVLAQQGRVSLDSDWNEQALIQAHRDRVTAADTIGRHGGPYGGAGMAITKPDGSPPRNTEGRDLRISAGRYYVDGILCENEQMVPLAAQPDLPEEPLKEKPGRYVAFLDVWLEHLSAAEQPGLLEVALGGATTTTRARTVWQVRLRSEGESLPPRSDGRLSARAVAPADGGPTACAAPSSAGFRRLENQLYRVEIHDPTPAKDPGQEEDQQAGPTFVWSRENGSVAARLLRIDGNVLTVDSPGRDDRLSFAQKPDAWVEVIDLARTRRGEAGFLGRVDHVDDTALTITIAEWDRSRQPVQGDLGDGAVVRRWESGPQQVEPGQWLRLEDGVEVCFEADGTFRTGDYWLIPARTANLDGAPVIPGLAGDVDWPRDSDGQPIPQFPEGIAHRYADIATMVLSEQGWTRESDDRHIYPALTDVDVKYAGGDGQQTVPGRPVPQPLEVSVSRGPTPVAGATVRFEAGDDGWLAADEAGLAALASSTPDARTGSSTLDAFTRSDGVARCYWLPAYDQDRPSPRVSARWVDEGGAATDPPIDFSAGFDLASATAFDPGDCHALTGAVTVQDAVRRLAAAPIVTIADGDGQTGARGKELGQPLKVRVNSGCGEVLRDVAVQFTTAADGIVTVTGPEGDTHSGPSVRAVTDKDGIAVCRWQPGSTSPVQTLTAEIDPGAEPAPLAAPVTFVAWTFVSGLHVTGAVLHTERETPLDLDAQVSAEDLAKGVSVILDGAPVAATVDKKPVLTVTLDLPFPVQPDPVWGQDVIGTTPLTLAADVRATERGGAPAITWTPTSVAGDLIKRLPAMMKELRHVPKVQAHLTLSGRTIAAAAGEDGVVNGLAITVIGRDGVPTVRLPSVDDVRGADFELRFWLVQVVTNIAVIPNRTGRLSLKSAMDAIALAVPRDMLRARLPDGVLVTDGPGQDTAAARRAVGRAFRNRVSRQLTIVVAEQYAAAADVIREAVAAAGLTLETVAAADPAAEVASRLAAGQPVDGVLTDQANAAAITALADFTAEVPL